MNFRSDNTAPAAPEIIAALMKVNEGAASAYGEDQWSKSLDEAFGALFECEVRVFTVASGTAANAISVASLTPSWGAVLCHREAHIECDECGAAEFYSGGAKLVLMEGEAAKVSPAAFREAIARNERGIHSVKPSALSVSQTTEKGAVYHPREIADLANVAKSAGLDVHMDGARFGNAVAALGCKPADITWRAGVDLLSFGATKNGAIAAEAIVCFDLERAEEIARRRKRSGHLFSKGRFVAAQLLAYLEDDLWLKLARRSNALAARLGEAASGYLSHPVESNQVFIRPGVDALAKLRTAGGEFYDWGSAQSGEARLVVSWDQSEADIAAMATLLAALR
ncbi:MAG: threonine aldolase [Hyphomonadaceae bacterium]|nr:threonine aldolase [Hyphomonadaceae bacterium]